MKILRETKDTHQIKTLILDYPSKDEIKEIYVPKHLFSKPVSEFLEKSLNIRLIPILMKDNPQIIRDLKSLVNSNTVLNNTKLSHLINKFNRTNMDRCVHILEQKQ